MKDIVERLRADIGRVREPLAGVLLEQAADEIERLRAEFELFREAPSKLEVAQYEIERLSDAVNVLKDGIAMRDAAIAQLRALTGREERD